MFWSLVPVFLGIAIIVVHLLNEDLFLNLSIKFSNKRKIIIGNKMWIKYLPIIAGVILILKGLISLIL